MCPVTIWYHWLKFLRTHNSRQTKTGIFSWSISSFIKLLKCYVCNQTVLFQPTWKFKSASFVCIICFNFSYQADKLYLLIEKLEDDHHQQIREEEGERQSGNLFVIQCSKLITKLKCCCVRTTMQLISSHKCVFMCMSGVQSALPAGSYALCSSLLR